MKNMKRIIKKIAILSKWQTIVWANFANLLVSAFGSKLKAPNMVQVVHSSTRFLKKKKGV